MEGEKIFLNICTGPECPEENKLETTNGKIETIHGCRQKDDDRTKERKCQDCDHLNSEECLKHKPDAELSHGYCKECGEKEMKRIEKFFKDKK
ncbi:MAG TPA: hypothetical protein ENJ27_02355 [Candidatus Moranbacteria bacterium]|nr:hypothetical protein [Candidatus Moranbacteria bacterium]